MGAGSHRFRWINIWSSFCCSRSCRRQAVIQIFIQRILNAGLFETNSCSFRPFASLSTESNCAKEKSLRINRAESKKPEEKVKTFDSRILWPYSFVPPCSLRLRILIFHFFLLHLFMTNSSCRWFGLLVKYSVKYLRDFFVRSLVVFEPRCDLSSMTGRKMTFHWYEHNRFAVESRNRRRTARRKREFI